MSSQNVPVIILKEGTQRSTGRDAQRNNLLAAKIVAETVRTTLGPRGMDKMLVSTIGDVVITNDGATIMKELDVQHPAAKMLVEVAKTQDNEVGDGTTTAVVLTGELLDKAEKLLDKDVHPTVIVEGYKKAAEKAEEILDGLSESIDPADAGTLRTIAITAMGTKGVSGAKEYLAKIAVDAALQVKETRNGKTTRQGHSHRQRDCTSTDAKENSECKDRPIEHQTGNREDGIRRQNQHQQSRTDETIPRRRRTHA
jgi:chaperonin GroEL (HSP60 family)